MKLTSACLDVCGGALAHGTGAHTDQLGAKCVESAWRSPVDGLPPVPSVPVAWSRTISRAKCLAEPQKELDWCNRVDKIIPAPTF